MSGTAAGSKTKLQMIVDCCQTQNGDQPLYLFSSGPTPASTTIYDCPPRIKKTNLNLSDKAFQNVMIDPRVCRGSYAMDLGTHVNENPFYPCFEMIKKDPLCQLYLRGLKKKCTGAKNITAVSKMTIAEGHNFDNVKSKSMQSLLKSKSKMTKNQEIDKLRRAYKGIAHSQSQTDTFFELLIDDVDFVGQEQQTDLVSDLDFAFLARKMVKEAKTGEDKDTQIQPGELFDFNEFVAPAVHNCANAVVEQALLELMMENELDMLLNQQRAYEYRKSLELSRLKRLQETQKSIIAENSQQIQSEKERMEQARETGEAISSAMFAKHFFSDILAVTIKDARKCGALQSPQEESHPFIQWLEEQAITENKKNVVSRQILDDIISYSVSSVIFNPNDADDFLAVEWFWGGADEGEDAEEFMSKTYWDGL